MKVIAKLLIVCALVALAGPVLAAPITDPNDPRTWQGASLETFRVLLGFPTKQDLVDANILDDDVFPPTAAYATTFSLPLVACGSSPAGIETPTYIGGVVGASGYSYNPLGYDYATPGASAAEYAERGRCVDMWWLQDVGNGDLTTGNVWDLGGAANQVSVFPIIDHGPLPQEAIEYSVYLSNNPNATQAGTDGNVDWVLATLDKVYLEGWTKGWIADGFTTVWRLPGGQTFRYTNVISGGAGALWKDGDDEIDAVIGLTFGGEPVCPGSSDQDADGVCDDTDNCVNVANPLQEDCDADGIGDVCPQPLDCNANGVSDPCDISAGTSADADGNGVPDECAPGSGGDGDEDEDEDEDGDTGGDDGVLDAPVQPIGHGLGLSNLSKSGPGSQQKPAGVPVRKPARHGAR